MIIALPGEFGIADTTNNAAAAAATSSSSSSDNIGEGFSGGDGWR